jgi:bifunctional enzyme CysN/CysC
VARKVEEGEFCEVFVDTPLAVAEERDPKGLCRKACRGELVNFTGVDASHEPLQDPEVRIETVHTEPDQAVAAIIDRLRSMSVVGF